MRLVSDPTLSNFIKFLRRDPTWADADKKDEFKMWGRTIIWEDGLLIRREEGKVRN